MAGGLRAPAAALVVSLVLVAAAHAAAADTLRSRTPRLAVAYLLKAADAPGMRGVADSIDRVHAARLDDAGRAALYFRMGDSAWVTHDDTTLAEVRRALDLQVLAEHRLRYAQGAPGVEQERRELDRRRQDLARRRRDLEAGRFGLRARIERERKAGHDTRSLTARQTTLDHQLAGLRAEEQAIARDQEGLARRAEEALRGDPAALAQRDRARRQAVEAIVTAMRRAIERGRARPFEP